MSDVNDLDEVELDDTEVDDEETDATEEEEWTPPTKAEFAKLQRQLKRANSEAKKAKEAAKAAPAEDDVEAAKEAAREEANERAKARIVKSEAKALLAAAGAKGDVSRLVKLINLEDVELTDDDELEGLEDQIEELKADYPEAFGAGSKSKGDARTRGDAAPKEASSGKALSSAEKIAQALQRRK